MKKKIVAIDFGERKMGFAISDSMQSIALPWKTTTEGAPSALKLLASREKEIEKIVVGLPLLMNGTKGEMAAKVEAFAKLVETSLNIPVVLFDERLSSKQADTALRETGSSRKKRDQHNDEIAATLLLQTYLLQL